MDNELKLCPFCGDTAYISFDNDYWNVVCFKCGASVSHLQVFNYDAESMKKGRKIAIEKWNKRV